MTYIIIVKPVATPILSDVDLTLANTVRLASGSGGDNLTVILSSDKLAGTIGLETTSDSEDIAIVSGKKIYVSAVAYYLEDDLTIYPTGFTSGTADFYFEREYNDFLTDSDLYNAQLNSIRLGVSPDLSAPISSDLLTNEIIDDPIFVTQSEIEVLQDAGLPIAVVDKSDSNYNRLLYLTQLKVRIEFIPKIPQLIRQGKLDSSVQYSEYDAELIVKSLTEKYNDGIQKINPSAGGDRTVEVDRVVSTVIPGLSY